MTHAHNRGYPRRLMHSVWTRFLTRYWDAASVTTKELRAWFHNAWKQVTAAAQSPGNHGHQTPRPRQENTMLMAPLCHPPTSTPRFEGPQHLQAPSSSMEPVDYLLSAIVEMEEDVKDQPPPSFMAEAAISHSCSHSTVVGCNANPRAGTTRAPFARAPRARAPSRHHQRHKSHTSNPPSPKSHTGSSPTGANTAPGNPPHRRHLPADAYGPAANSLRATTPSNGAMHRPPHLRPHSHPTARPAATPRGTARHSSTTGSSNTGCSHPATGGPPFDNEPTSVISQPVAWPRPSHQLDHQPAPP